MTNMSFQIGDVVRYNSDDPHGINCLKHGDVGIIYSVKKFDNHHIEARIHWVNENIQRINYLYYYKDLMLLNRPSEQPIQFNPNELKQIKHLAIIIKDSTNSSGVYNIANAIIKKLETLK